MTFTIRDLLWLIALVAVLGCSTLAPPARKPAVTYTDGPTPLTEEQFADLQKWLRDECKQKSFSVQGMILDFGMGKSLAIEHRCVGGELNVTQEFLGGLDPDRLVKVTFEVIEE